VRADISVTLPRPPQRSPLDVVKINALQPLILHLGELALANLIRELLGPPPRVVVRLPPRAADQPLGNRAVPDMVQVEVVPIPEHMNPIPATSNVFVVKRLMHVADEVHHEACCLVALPAAQVVVESTRRVVRECGDDAAILLAVALQLHTAVRRRVVLGVDEVEDAREVTPARIADGVCPGGDLGEVVLRWVAEQVLEEGLGAVGDELTSDVGSRDMTQTWQVSAFCIEVSRMLGFLTSPSQRSPSRCANHHSSVRELHIRE